MEWGLTECRNGAFPAIKAGHLNAKHTAWNSRLITARGSVLRDYANRNFCFINGQDSRPTAPYTRNGSLGVLDLFVAKDSVLLAHPTVSSARSSDHLPVPIDTTCRLFFLNLTGRLDLTRMGWPHSRLAMKTDSGESHGE
jgi:hypothetical protein